MTPDFSDFQKIAASGSNVFVAWREQGNNLFFTASTDGGQTFGSNINLSGNQGLLGAQGLLNPPQIAAAGNTVYLAWDSSLNPPNHTFFTTSTNGGMDFAAAQDLRSNSTFAVQPQMAVSGGNVYVAWSDSITGNFDIWLRADTGSGFGSAINVSNNTGDSGSQRIAAVGNNVYVAWADKTFGNPDIFFAVSNDGGGGFSNPVNLSKNAMGTADPAIAVSGPNVYVSWWGAGPNSADVFLRAGVPPIAAVQSATMAGTVSFSTNAGGFSSMSAVSDASLPQPEPPGVTFPYGLFDWTITGLPPPPPQTVTVTITYPANIPVGAPYWKVINSAWTYATQLLGGSNNDGDNILKLTLTDGAMGQDTDSLVNSEISDPGGVALAIVPVTIDIKPGSSPNTVNPKDQGVVSVAILSSRAFDAATVDPATIRFGATGTEAASVRSDLRDVNRDRRQDLVLQFRVPDTRIQCGMRSATVTGKTKSGQPIQGSDSIVTVGCR
jgi:hypothetical protein